MKVYGVFDCSVCRAGNFCVGEDNEVLVRLCKSEETARSYLDRWIRAHPDCEVNNEHTEAIEYFNECDMCGLVPGAKKVSEKEYTRNDGFGGFHERFILELDLID